jgi:hypothetical protein
MVTPQPREAKVVSPVSASLLAAGPEQVGSGDRGLVAEVALREMGNPSLMLALDYVIVLAELRPRRRCAGAFGTAAELRGGRGFEVRVERTPRRRSRALLNLDPRPPSPI